jgi:hypothetical protein
VASHSLKLKASVPTDSSESVEHRHGSPGDAEEWASADEEVVPTTRPIAPPRPQQVRFVLFSHFALVDS